MRGITIRYSYAGDEDAWRQTIADFIAAFESDADVPGRFVYQVAVADNGTDRIHWGRWDSAETLAHIQSQDYFKTFAGKVRDFSGGALDATGHDIVLKSAGW